MRSFSVFAALIFVCGSASVVQADRTLVSEADVDASPAEVWKAWTTEEGFTSWAVAKAKIDLRVGGEMVSSYITDSTLNDDSTIINRILSFDPERMLSIQNIRAPKAFKNAHLFQGAWTVLYLEPLGAERTHVRIVGLGYGEGQEWDEIYNKFKIGNDLTLKKLQQKFAPAADTASEPTIDAHNIVASDRDATSNDSQRVFALLGRLVGGEWIHDGHAPDGSVFLVRNVMERGPDGVSIVGEGWLGNAEGMIPHGSTQIYRDPGSGTVRFLNINEHGAVSQGDIVLIDDQTLQWNWLLHGQDGDRAMFRVLMKFADANHYQFTLSTKNEDEQWMQMVTADFTRVQEVPAKFTNIRPTP